MRVGAIHQPQAPQPLSVQAAFTGHPMAVQSAAEAPASAVAEAPSAAEAGEAGDEETRIEDLAGKLYDKIRVRLRNELLVDRERAGFLTDLR
jgi:hypothetical protein